MTHLRRIQVGLGLLWLVDAALQCQPFMFTAAFAHEVLRAAGDGQPAVVVAPAHLAADVVASSPAAFNAAFIAVQLALGLALLIPRTVRVGLAGSVVWGLGVWLLGEGAGGLAGGHLTLFTGAPGAALLYAVIAVVAWPRAKSCDGRARRTATVAWAAIWIGGGLFQMLPGQNTGSALASAIDDAAGDAPVWLHAPLAHLAAGLPRGAAVAVALALVQLLVGVLALMPAARRIAVATGVVVSALFFVAGQSLGGLTTGQATDPNAAPVLALLALAVIDAPGMTRVAVAPRHLSSVRWRTVVETNTP